MSDGDELVSLVQKLSREAQLALKTCGRSELDTLEAVARKYLKLCQELKARGVIECPCTIALIFRPAGTFAATSCARSAHASPAPSRVRTSDGRREWRSTWRIPVMRTRSAASAVRTAPDGCGFRTVRKFR